jgi:uncharacterized protein (TIGR03790 family)
MPERRVSPVPGGLLLLLGLSSVTTPLFGAGSGLNTLVIANQNSSNSCALANYYCERRQVPPQNVLRINWTGGNTAWTRADFQAVLLQPLLNTVAARQLTSQIQYVVLSMDIPFATTAGSSVNSTTSALFYGVKDDYGVGWLGITNSYFAAERDFVRAFPASAPGYSFLATMITGNTLQQAKQVVDQGVAADSTFPRRPVLLEKTSDPTRNFRYKSFDDAIFNTRFCPNSLVYRTNSDSPPAANAKLLGYETGLWQFNVASNCFVPGALADSLTSYGGVIFGPNDQTTLLALLAAGAAGSYGTVTEPSPNPEKFPSPEVYFYQGRGFSLAECYYQSIFDPHEGLIGGEPLSSPFAQSGTGQLAITNAFPLSGACPVRIAFSSAGVDRPLDRVDLFLDGQFIRTVTNCVPASGNQLRVALNGYPMFYTVPAGASRETIATDLSALFNSQSTITKVTAAPHGDRVELQSVSTNRAQETFYFSTTPGDGVNFYRIAYLPGPATPVLSQLSRDGYGFNFHVDAGAQPYVIEASTDLQLWVPILSLPGGGPFDFSDPDAVLFPRRFYRINAVLPDPHPQLTLLGAPGQSHAAIQVTSASATPYLVQASADLTNWLTIATNTSGGSMTFSDSNAAAYPVRFYRTASFQPEAPDTRFVGVQQDGTILSKVDGATQPFAIQVSSDFLHWTPVFTNYLAGRTSLETSVVTGTNAMLSTQLVAARNHFLNSPAFGARSYSVNGVLDPGTWLQVTVAKTNGSIVSLSVTNPSYDGTIITLAQQLTNAIGSCAGLQGPDGMTVDDFTTGWFGAANFTLRPRSPGWDAARVQVTLDGASSLVLSTTGAAALDQNVADLYPRNQLYVASGAPALSLLASLDTTACADGFHELTAVAYEGSSVRTQTRATVPLQVANTTLNATLASVDLTPIASVQGTYHFQVNVTGTNSPTIRLFSTGGELMAVTNQSSATFTVPGSLLGEGLHTFYATADAAPGASFRTAPLRARLVWP